MFESDDFDLDEDFLRDIDDKESTYFTQQNEEDVEEESLTKKQKLNEICAKTRVGNPVEEAYNDRKSGEEIQTSTVSSRKTLVLSIFEKYDSRETHLKSTANETQDSSSARPFPPPSDTLERSNSHSKINVANSSENNDRKNLILSILKKSTPGVQSKSPEAKSSSSPQRSRQKKNAPQAESLERNASKVLREPLPNRETHAKTPEKRKTRVSSDSSTPCKKLTLVRKFPGPAGLLPDTKDAFLPPILHMDPLNETEEEVKDSDRSKVSEYYSQNTRNLFSEGAWRRMLDDLPPNFLNGHEIATIKREARANAYKSGKIPILAGVIQRVEHSFENPYVLLKDHTDVIEGIVHRDVPGKYPNALEPGVVLLLENPGLLMTGTFVKKCHVIIAPGNVLNIYTPEGKIAGVSSAEHPRKTITDEELIGDKENLSLRFSDPVESYWDSDTEKRIVTREKSSTEESIANVIIAKDKPNTVSPSRLLKRDTVEEMVPASKSVERNVNNERLAHDEENERSPSSLNITPAEPSSAISDSRKERAQREENAGTVHSGQPEKVKVSVRSKLLQFRSNDVLTPPISHGETSFVGDLLCDAESDSDDELLSQLDVDAITSNYN